MSTGIIKIKSSNDFETTYIKLKTVLENNPMIGIVAELDHQKNAARVDLTLPKTRMILFGNPRLGTPLMNTNITMSLDLPQKFIIAEQGGEVQIIFNDPIYLKERHSIENKDEIFEKINGALHKIAGVAAS